MSHSSAGHSAKSGRSSGHGGRFSCTNCGRENHGDFCATCGQKRLHPGDLGVAHVWHHIVHELLHLDGKIFNTLRLMFVRPGRLTLDFLEGRRARHIHPIRLFLVFSSIYFFFAHLDVTKNNQGLNVRLNSEALARVDARAAETGSTRAEVLEGLHARLRPVQKSVILASLLLNGFWLWAMFRGRWHYLGEHMVMALHLASFQLVVLTITGWFELRPVGTWLTVDPWPLVASLLYFLPASRLVYGGAWPALFVKWLVQVSVGIVIVTFAGGAFAILIVKSFLSSLS